MGAGLLALGLWPFLEAARHARAITSAASAHLSPGPVVRLTTGTDLNTEPSVSADGEWVAYASDRSGEGQLDVWMQRLSGGEPVQLTRHPADDREPTFSADGSRIAFRSERDGGGIYVMPAHSGGEASLLVPGGAHGARFSPDGRWLAYSVGPGRFSMDKALPLLGQTYLISSSGGTPKRLLSDFLSATWPVWSPDSRHLLLTAKRHLTDDSEWWVVPTDGGTPVRVSGLDVNRGINTGGGLWFPVRPWTWIEGNRIVYSGTFGGDSWDLWEVGVAEGTWKASDEPRRLTTGANLQGHASIARSELVFSSVTLTVNVWSVPLRADTGSVMGAPSRITATSALQWSPSVSKDGRRLVFWADKVGSGGIWMRDDPDREVLLVPTRAAVGPVISSDGSRVAYGINEKGWMIYGVAASGGPPERLCGDCADGFAGVQDWSKDKTRLLYLTGTPTAVFALDLRTGTKKLVVRSSGNNLYQARFSPDNRWVTFLEPLSAAGRTRLWIAPFKDGSTPASEWIALTAGEHWDDKPRWSPDATLMYFVSLRDGFWCIWAQRFQPDTKQPIGPPFAVQHFHSARLSMNNTGFAGLEMSVARDKIVINLGELSGNIWATRLH